MAIYNGTQKVKISGISKVYIGSTLVFDSTPSGPKTLVSISLTVDGDKQERGETYAFDGTVTALYSDNTTADVTSSTTFSGYNMAVSGDYTVTASYTEGGITETATYEFTVTPAWSTLWSGSQEIKVTTAGTLTPSSTTVLATTATGTGYSPMLRITFSSFSGLLPGYPASSMTTYYNNTASATGNTQTMPRSPLELELDSTNYATIVGENVQVTDNANKTCTLRIRLATEHVSADNNISISASPWYTIATGFNSQFVGDAYYAKFTITKIEQYY